MKTSNIIVSLSALMFVVGCAQTPTTSSTASSTTAAPATTTPSVTEQAQATASDTAAAAKEVAQETKDAAVAHTQAAVTAGKTQITEVSTTTKQTASKTVASAKETASKTTTATKAAASNATTAATSTASGASITTMPDWVKTPTYDCRGCHAIDTKIIGPAWRDVAKRYKGDAAAETKLMAKVKNGGKGNWTSITGGIPMTPHPKLTDDELKKVVDFILSLD